MSQSHVETHMELIAQQEQDFLAKRTKSERLSDSIAVFVGSFRFVVTQILLFAVWLGWNSLRDTLHFDPPPFPFLGIALAMEAILLASFILMRQARVARRADERDHLMLQILILAEKEITAILKMDRQIAHQVGAAQAANTAEVKELSQQTSIENVAQTIRENLDAVLEASQ